VRQRSLSSLWFSRELGDCDAARHQWGLWSLRRDGHAA
jgi:hypothetical protein